MKKVLLITILLIAVESYSQTSFFNESFTKRPPLIDSIIKAIPGYTVSKIDSSGNGDPVHCIAYLKKENSEPILIYYLKEKNGASHVVSNVRIAAPFAINFAIWKKWIDIKSDPERIFQSGVERRFIDGKIFAISRYEKVWMLSL